VLLSGAMAGKRSKRKTTAAKKKPHKAKAKAKAVAARAKTAPAKASPPGGDIDLLRGWSPSRYSNR
jgi:hypothetical protein